MTTSITSTGGGKGAVSTSTAYKTKLTAEQTKANKATLNKSIKDLSKINAGLNADIARYGKEIAQAQAEYVSGIWGPGTPLEGQTMSTQDLANTAQLIADITAEKSAATSKIAKNQTTISNDLIKIGKLSKPVDTKKWSFATAGTGVGSKASSSSTSTTFKPPPEFPDSTYQWNLPPHAWSLPVDPYDIAPDTTVKRTDNFHSTRRGRIWFYNGYVGPIYQASANTGTYAPAAGTGTTATPKDQNKYGFQFIWNPETFTQATSVNMSVTPSGTDPSIALTGFAAANSTMSFTLRLDRTNDFTCAKSYFVATPITTTSDNANSRENRVTTTGYQDAKAFTQFYTIGNPVNSDNDFQTHMESKIKDLMQYGTEADLEYLYRTINGDGWTGIGGRKTSNMGYLMPALIRVDLGNQKFVGVVSSVGVNHLAFTRDMVPIRTDVNITIDLRANIQPSITNGQTTL